MSRCLLATICATKKHDPILFVLRGLHGPAKPNEYSETSLYKPIKPFKNEAEEAVYQTKKTIRDMKTVEEKQYQINRPKMYGWYTYHLNPDDIPIDLLDFTKFSTWTTVINSLPQFFKDESVDKEADKILSEVSPQLEQVLLNETVFREKNYQVPNDRAPYCELHSREDIRPVVYEKLNSQSVIAKIHEVLLAHLSLTKPHLKESGEDYEARQEAFWFRGGIRPDKLMLKKREGLVKKKKRLAWAGKPLHPRLKNVEEKLYEPYERAIQIKHKSVVQLRHELPLAEFVDRDDPLVTNINVPIVDMDPRMYGLKRTTQHGTNIPGYWPEDANQLGLLAYYTRVNRYNYLDTDEKNPEFQQFEREQDLAKGIQTNFAWTLAQACHLGFSPLTELTFPLTSQSVNTDGKTWSFFAYQLNTCDLSDNEPQNQTHQNILWAEDPHQLYTDIKHGKVEGFNPAALKPLIKMMMNEPRAREYSLRPYLDPEMPTVTDHPDAYQRNSMLQYMRSQYARKPNQKMPKPELYYWEKMLLVDHNMMPEMSLNRRQRWWHMYKYDFLGKEHWHPEFVNADVKKNTYIAKGKREPWTRQGKYNRRYNKFQPKLQVPLKDKIAVYSVPSMKYKDQEDNYEG